MGDKHFFVYILTNQTNKVLYTGITSNLKKRIYEHKCKYVTGFTYKYNVIKLVYYEILLDGYSAITREKQIKGWLRRKKLDLINAFNPDWKDLYFEI